MKITSIDIHPFDIKMGEPFRIATATMPCSPNVLVHIHTDEGLDGWGEASPLYSIVGETQAICIAAAKELRPLLVGKDPLEIGARVQDMDQFLPHNSTAKSAFDMALYDIAGKAAGMPLYRLLGGNRRPMETDLTIGLCHPKDAAKKAAAVLARGFKIIKVKLGTGFKEDLARLTNTREAAPNARIRIDANQGWDRVTAVKALTAFEELDIEFCEQPLAAHDVKGLREVGGSVGIPLMADEALFTPASALHLIEEEACAYFNIKLSKAGGIHNALKTAAIAEAGGVRCMVGCMLESRLGLGAAVHFARAAQCVDFYDLDMCFEHTEELIDGGISIKNGMISISDEPGIGAAPKPEVVARLPKVD
jgi:L-alanine-DL-glutamate epimerase-like enolase superfamily enzyme